MKHLRRVGLAISVTSICTGILLACGDDTAVLLETAADSGGDAKSIQAVDSSANTGDTDVPDSQRPDTGGPDADTPDADAPDADADAPRDAQADVDIPPIDAGGPDADASDLAVNFPARLAEEFCKTTARCCFGDSDTAADAPVDGGLYDRQHCLDLYTTGGLDQSSPNAQGAADFTKVAYDPSKAAECLGRIRVLSCGANAAEYRAMILACYAALPGMQAAGELCNRSSECQPGFFCNTADKATTDAGACEAIRGTDSDCGDWTTSLVQSQNSCSNRYSTDPPRYCTVLDDSGNLRPKTDWKCADSRAIGATCANDSWCATGLCVSNGGLGTCQDFTTIFTAPACGLFIKP